MTGRAITEYLLYNDGEGAEFIPSLDDLPDFSSQNKPFFWLDVTNPTAGDLQWLETHLSIHPLTIEDITLGESREKCEYYSNYIFISLQLLDEEDFYGRIQSPLRHSSSTFSQERTENKPLTLESRNQFTCYMLIYSYCLVTVHWNELSCRDAVLARRIPMATASTASLPSLLFNPQSSRSRDSETMSFSTILSPDWVAYLIIDEIVDGFVRQCALLENEVDAIEDLASALGRFDQMDLLRRIYQAHRRVTLLGRLIQPKLEVIRSLAKHSTPLAEATPGTNIAGSDALPNVQDTVNTANIPLHPNITATTFRHRTILYLRDVTDHLHSIRGDLGEFSETLNRVHDHYLGRSEIELAMTGHRMDVTVKKITSLAFAVGFSVVISSVMGMNVRVPFENYPKELPSWSLLLPFFLLIVGMLSVSLTVYLVGRYKKWL